MKTKNLTLTILMVICTITGTFAQANTAASGNWMNSFSFTEYLLMLALCVMAAVVWLMGRTIRSLSEQLR